MSNRHHFLPQFYLRRFASDPQQIHVYNLKRETLIRGASLRDQCYKRRFYVHQELEDDFAAFETFVAPILASIIDRSRLPAHGSTDHSGVLQFISLQMLRTVAALQRVDQALRSFSNVAFDPSDPHKPEPSGHEELLAISLSQAPQLAATLSDLAMRLVVAAPDTPFVTSDNPVYKYNSFCEGVAWSGVVGAGCSGLQIFLPLAPSHLLMLFDTKVYATGQRSGDAISKATHSDIRALNVLQGVSAHRNLYSNLADEANLRSVVGAGKRHRGANRPVTIEAVNDRDSRESLVHQYERMPTLKLQLSFIAVRRRARRIPIAERARMYRDGHKLPRGMVEEGRLGAARRYSEHRRL